MAAPTLFVSLAQNWDAAITAGVTQTVANEIAANATLLTSMITLWLIVSGCLTMFGRMSMSEWVFGATRAAMVSLLLTMAMFSQYIQPPLMTEIPNWIAQSVNGNAGAQTGAQQFDAVLNTVANQEAAILQQASGWTQFGERIRASVLFEAAGFDLLITFVVWETARSLMGVLVATAPFVLGFYLFKTTRHIPLNLAGLAVSLLVLSVMIAVLLAISLNADQAWLAQSRDAGASIEIQLQILGDSVLFFLFGTAISVALPTLAAFVGRGVIPAFAGGGLTLNAMNTVTRSLTAASAQLLRAAESITRAPK